VTNILKKQDVKTVDGELLKKAYLEDSTRSSSLIKIPTFATFVYSDYITTDVEIIDISPNLKKDFWGKTTLFTLTLHSENKWRLDLRLRYPTKYNKMLDESYLIVKEDTPLMFQGGKYLSSEVDYDCVLNLLLVCQFQPCPPKEAKDILYKIGWLKEDRQNTLNMKDIRKLLHGPSLTDLCKGGK
jgi:hypothetical protein